MVTKETDRRDKMWMLLVEFSSRLPLERVESLQEDIRAGEYRIYLESLCSNLYDFDLAVRPKFLALISELAAWMKVDARYWSVLRVESDGE